MTSVLEQLDRRVNPLLIKEMYQSLHSRKFVASLWIMLACCLAAFGLITAAAEPGTGQYGAGPVNRQCGDDLYTAFGVVLFLASGIVLPLLAFFNLFEEIRSGTLELVQITRLDARQQVRGRLFASLVKAVVIFAVIGPFAVAAFLYKRIGVFEILGALYVNFLYALLACALAIYLAALARIRQFRTLARIAVLGLVVLGAGLLIPAVGDGLPFREDDFDLGGLLGWLLGGVLTALFVWFIAAGSANTLTYESDKSSHRSKLALVIMLATALAGLVVIGLADRLYHGTAQAFAICALLAVSVFGAYWMTGPTRLSVRLRKRLDHAGAAVRLLSFPFVDGPGSSAAYFLGFLVLVGFGTAVVLGFPHPDWDWDFGDAGFAFAIVIYALYLSALSRMIASRLPARVQSVRTARICLLGLLTANLIAPLIWLPFARGDGPPANVLTGFFPILYFAARSDYRSDSFVVVDLFLPALIGILYFGIAAVVQFEDYRFGRYEEGGIKVQRAKHGIRRRPQDSG
jgi:hypothetical protein